jgi:O-antigen ligase
MSREYLDARWLTHSGDPSRAARSSHNTFMTALVEHGILGAVLYIWLTLWGAMAIVRVKALQRRRVSAELTGPAAACCAGIAVVWSAGQFTDYLHAEVQFWLFAALAASLEQLRRTVLRPVVVPFGTTGTPQAVDPRGAA